jgi:hypothetical protein
MYPIDLSIGTGPIDVIVSILQLLGITSMCSISADYTGCDGRLR